MRRRASGSTVRCPTSRDGELHRRATALILRRHPAQRDHDGTHRAPPRARGPPGRARRTTRPRRRRSRDDAACRPATFMTRSDAPCTAGAVSQVDVLDEQGRATDQRARPAEAQQEQGHAEPGHVVGRRRCAESARDGEGSRLLRPRRRAAEPVGGPTSGLSAYIPATHRDDEADELQLHVDVAHVHRRHDHHHDHHCVADGHRGDAQTRRRAARMRDAVAQPRRCGRPRRRPPRPRAYARQPVGSGRRNWHQQRRDAQAHRRHDVRAGQLREAEQTARRPDTSSRFGPRIAPIVEAHTTIDRSRARRSGRARDPLRRNEAW